MHAGAALHTSNQHLRGEKVIVVSNRFGAREGPAGEGLENPKSKTRSCTVRGVCFLVPALKNALHQIH
jgi:hypothetical protein